MSKDISFSFSDPIYLWRTQVVITEDIGKWNKKYPCSGDSGAPDALFVRPSEKRHSIIIIQPNSPLDDLQHEIGHAARCVMNHIGFTVDFANDEPLAYYEGYLTRQIHAKLKKLKPRKCREENQKEGK